MNGFVHPQVSPGLPLPSVFIGVYSAELSRKLRKFCTLLSPPSVITPGSASCLDSSEILEIPGTFPVYYAKRSRMLLITVFSALNAGSVLPAFPTESREITAQQSEIRGGFQWGGQLSRGFHFPEKFSLFHSES